MAQALNQSLLGMLKKKKQGSQREQSGVNEHKFIGNRSEGQCRRRRQWEACWPGKDFGIYSKRDGKQLEESDLRKDVIWIIFNHIVLISSQNKKASVEAGTVVFLKKKKATVNI